ncbi:unnamed protein product [Fraxinus pennsylvanica]|uniref:DUF674 family protein n=1 Tax=Fraxinus pennsylvanica TaxID=56036 RepID=A0AAD2A5B9_9LAMI|nr:unnamed protein product [Fraxinus pennsylvanica]
MSTEKKNIKPSISLKLLVDEKKTRVLAAEATSDFVNALLSFLTIPLGTVVRVTKNHPGSIGCMNNLYQSIGQLSADNFCTEACKSILLRPRNPHALVCKNLKLNIDDTSNEKLFFCSMNSTCREWTSHYPNTKCTCGRIADREMPEGSQPSDPECFVKRRTMCVITDDLQVLPGNPISLAQVLSDLGFSDVHQVEELSVDVGLDEVSKLLKHSLVSKTPLTVYSWGKGNLQIFRYLWIQEIHLHQAEKIEHCRIILNSGFCTVPLGSVVKLFDSNSGVGCVDNLYRTVESLDSEWLAISKDELRNAGVLKQYKCKNHPLQFPDAKKIWNLRDPRSPTGRDDCFGRFMEAGPHLFVVSDNLIVTPLSSPSSISFLKELNVPLNDIGEKEETIRETEALALLKASLTSSSALNNCFKSSGNQKLDKSDVAGK